jgi:flagellar basal-body rod protein FlgC
MDLRAAMRIAGAGMKVQSERLRVVAENLANAESTGGAPGADAYRRRTISFRTPEDPESGLHLVDVGRLGVDPSSLPRRYLPGDPAADAQGYVTFPNVKPLIELMDMREAQRSYEANLSALQMARQMIERTLDLLR